MRLNHIMQSGFLKNSAKLVAGTATAQAISFLVIPFITRLYTPAQFGAFTVFLSVAGGLGLIGTLRYEMAVVLPKREKDSVNVVFLSLITAFLLSVFLAILVLLFNFLSWPGLEVDPITRQWSYLIPIMVFLVAAGNVFQHWFNRKKEYRTLALAKVINSAGNNLLTLYLGFIGIGVWGLLLGNFLGLLVFNLFFILGIYLRHRRILYFFNLSSQKNLAKKYKHLPLANTPQVLVELIQVYGVIFLLQAFFTSEIVGWYSLSQRVMQAPMTLIGTSFAQVFYKDASEIHVNGGNLTGLVKKTIKTSALVAFIPMMVMVAAGPWLMAAVFGHSWREAGVYSRILAPWMFFDFIRASISYTPIIIGKTRMMFFISLAGAVLMVLQISLGGIFFESVTTSLILLSAMLSLYSLGVTGWILWSVKRIQPTESRF